MHDEEPGEASEMTESCHGCDDVPNVCLEEALDLYSDEMDYEMHGGY
jgi:hypothetical protein